ncbi:hypothetical protein SCHPADRAFT_702379 [Schizopora paradoxa]|uniref:Secreted protein n=1 Tax=Schizopora paradoxa TaxID=27342 RepID=A0A0H2R2P5_9AGAM|nr:hypothetical protein SCHPADRAFT_702379 [Schizopora paradoxa]
MRVGNCVIFCRTRFLSVLHLTPWTSSVPVSHPVSSHRPSPCIGIRIHSSTTKSSQTFYAQEDAPSRCQDSGSSTQSVKSFLTSSRKHRRSNRRECDRIVGFLLSFFLHKRFFRCWVDEDAPTDRQLAVE